MKESRHQITRCALASIAQRRAELLAQRQEIADELSALSAMEEGHQTALGLEKNDDPAV